MTALAVPIALALVVSAAVALRPHWQPGVLLRSASVALLLGLAVRGGPWADPAVGRLTGMAGAVSAAAGAWQLILVVVLALAALVAAAPAAEQRVGSAALGVGALVFLLVVADAGPITAALLAGSALLLGVAPLARTGGTRAVIGDATRVVVLVALAVFALAGAATLATAAYRTGETALAGPAIGLLTLGALIVGGTFPFHSWWPALAERPTRWTVAVVAALLQTVGLGVVLALFLEAPWLFDEFRQPTLLLVASGAALGSALLAVGEKHAGRSLAHLFGAQAGLILAGMALRSQLAGTGAVLLLLGLGPLLLLALAPGGDTTAGRLARGVGWLGVLGLPPTPAFWGRAMVTMAALGAHPLAAGLLVAAQLFALAAAARHGGAWRLAAADVPTGEAGPPRIGDTPPLASSARWLAVVALGVVACGLVPRPLLAVIARALALAPLGP